MLAANLTGTESFVHRLMPTTKLIAVVLFWITALLSVNVVPLIAMIFISLFLWVIARIDLRALRPILIVTGIILVIFTTLNGFLFYGGKTVLFHFLGVPFYREGAIFGVSIWLKLLAVVTIFPVLTFTTPLPLLLAALAKLKMPYKLIFTLGMAFRLTPLVNETYRDIVESQLLRGHDLKRMNFFKRLITGYMPLFIPLVMTLLRRSGDLDIAIESRGFGAPVERSYLVEVKTTWRDWVFLVLFMIAFAFIVFLIVTGGTQGMIYYWL